MYTSRSKQAIVAGRCWKFGFESSNPGWYLEKYFFHNKNKAVHFGNFIPGLLS